MKILHTLLLSLTVTSLLHAQPYDTLSFTLSTSYQGAGQPYLTYWQTAQQWGTIPDQPQPVLLISPSIQYQRKWKQSWQVRLGGRVYYELNSQNRQLNELFTSIQYKALVLRIGRFRQQWVSTDSLLSSGSLGISANALPPPALQISLDDYVSVPFTKDWLQIKGRWHHAWLGQDRYVKGALLHAKNMYLRTGNDRWKIYAGLNHFAQWGGQHPDGKLPDEFTDYLRIIIGLPQNPKNIPSGAPTNIYNALGNHILITDIGAGINFGELCIKAYTQTIYDRGRNEAIYGRDQIQALHIFGKDRLIGISTEYAQVKILLEYLYTLYQGGPGVFVGQFNYYNNAIYRSGWTYQGQVLGTPLFLTQQQAQQYFPDRSDFGSSTIVSNRVRAWHLGASLKPAKEIQLRQLLTCVRHYGNYYNDAFFSAPPQQLYGLTEVAYQFHAHLVSKAKLSWDLGEPSHNVGFSLGLQWHFHRASALAPE